MIFGRRRRTKLVVHIGAAKCGSTSIQRFLAANRDALQAAGIVVPGRNIDPRGERPDLHLLYFAENGADTDDTKRFHERIRAVGTFARAQRCETIVLSAENLINPSGQSQMFAELVKDFDVRVVAFVRRQDDYLLAAWQQWHLKRFESLDAFLSDSRGAIDWHARLEPWRQAVGLDRISVHRLVPGTDSVAVLCGHVGIIESQYELPPRLNSSLDEQLCSYANRHREALFSGPHDGAFFDFARESLGHLADKRYSGSALLTLDERHSIMSDHEDANLRLRRVYFPHLADGHDLFDAPSASDVAGPDRAELTDAEIERLAADFARHRLGGQG